MSNYYAKNLHSGNLHQVYQTDIERVRQYLDEEIDFIRRELQGREKVLELGAGYGRVMKKLAPFAASITGIDISEDSVLFGKEYLKDNHNCRLIVMDAHKIRYVSEFDVVLCLQNGLSAMKGQSVGFVQRCVKALTSGGKAYFSTYCPGFWEHRVAWFQEQADKGLLGEIDLDKTRNGKIVCKDGFVATTSSREELEEIARELGYPFCLKEVDDSSLFLIIQKTGTQF